MKQPIVWNPRFENQKYNPHLGCCQICERENIHVEDHHLIPKDKRSEKIKVCQPCADQIHTLFTNVELAQNYNTLEKLKSSPQIQKFVKWLRKQNPEHIKVRESHHVKKWRRRK